MKIFKNIISIAFLFSVFAVYGQSSEMSRLALQYFQKQEFDKSAELYKKIYAQSGSQIHLNYLIKSLTATNDYQSAVKFIEKQIKKDKTNLPLYVLLGSVYEESGNIKKASEVYKEAISKLHKNRNSTVALAEAFKNDRKLDYAEQTYLTGRKLNPEKYYEELGQIYYYQKNYDKMIDAYLSLIKEEPSKVSVAQNQMQNAIYFDADKTVKSKLKTQLVQAIQKWPNHIEFNEMLIWLFTQDNDFESAFYQASALDQRNSEDGNRLLKLARIAKSNGDYKTAVKCYEYIESKNNSIYHNIANKELLNTLSEQLFSQPDPSLADMQLLESKYQEVLNKAGLNSQTLETALELAKLQGLYMKKYDNAILMAEKCVENSRSPSNKAMARMALADIYLYSGDIWEANLLYAKVESDNPHNPTGYEAKLKKAQTAYYAGNFEWAEAMLDVLKASTSKLIANDAFELSQLIKDNTALDTSFAAMKLFAEADYLLLRGDKTGAIAKLDTLSKQYPGHSLEDDIIFKKAEIYLSLKEYTKAADALQNIIDYYAYDILADNALFKLAELNENVLKNKAAAMELYEKIISDYKNSIYLSEARQRFRSLQKEEF